MTSWPSSVATKLERGREHISSLTEEIRAFLARQPYRVDLTIEPASGDRVGRIRVDRQPPMRWGAVAGDVFHNLRSGLEILFRAAVYPAGGGEGDRTLVFPVFEDKDALNAGLEGLIRKYGPGLSAAIEYLGKEDEIRESLFLLTRASNVDKHRVLVPVFALLRQTVLDVSGIMQWRANEAGLAWSIPSFPVTLNWSEPSFPIADGEEIYRFKNHPAGAPELAPSFPVEIAFGGGPLQGRPIIRSLVSMADAVDRAVRQFREAGLVP